MVSLPVRLRCKSEESNVHRFDDVPLTFDRFIPACARATRMSAIAFDFATFAFYNLCNHGGIISKQAHKRTR